MVRIGTAGWSVPRGVSAQFPAEGSHLERYAQVFSCVEINSSFYKLPRMGTWVKWAAMVPEEFRFAVKAPKAITHEAKLRGGAETLRGLLDGVQGLGQKLGPVLFQLPPSLAFDDAVMRRFLTVLRGAFHGTVVLEPRHASWFTGEVAELLAAHEVARVAADPARVAEAGEPGGWAGVRYWRLHGSPRMYYSAYGEEWLRAMAKRVREGDWVVFDNTAAGMAAEDALRLTELTVNDR